MAHYAFLDENNIVQAVYVGIDENDLTELPEGYDSWESYYSFIKGMTCKRTSYSTVANTHNDGGTPFRGNYAGIGYTYDETNDVFIPTKVYESWVLDETTWTWKPPIPMPELTEQQKAEYNYYSWNEETVNWDLIDSETEL